MKKLMIILALLLGTAGLYAQADTSFVQKADSSDFVDLLLCHKDFYSYMDLDEIAFQTQANLERIPLYTTIKDKNVGDLMISMLDKKHRFYEIINGRGKETWNVLRIFYGKNKPNSVRYSGKEEFSICLRVETSQSEKKYCFCQKDWSGGYYYSEYGQLRGSLLIGIGACNGFFRIMTPAEAAYFNQQAAAILKAVNEAAKENTEKKTQTFTKTRN